MTKIVITSTTRNVSIFNSSSVQENQPQSPEMSNKKRSFDSLVKCALFPDGKPLKKSKTCACGALDGNDESLLSKSYRWSFINSIFRMIDESDEATKNIRVAADKLSRELFIGNIPVDVTDEELIEFLNRVMRRRKLCKKDDEPFKSGRVNNKFAFIECGAAKDFEKACCLNGVLFKGKKLRIVHRKRCLASNRNIIVESPSERSDKDISDVSKKNTRMIKIKNILNADDLDSDDDYENVLKDTKEEFSHFGVITNIVIPRTGVNATHIFLEYATDEEAAKALKSLDNRLFDDHEVEAEYISKESFSTVVTPN